MDDFLETMNELRICNRHDWLSMCHLFEGRLPADFVPPVNLNTEGFARHDAESKDAVARCLAYARGEPSLFSLKLLVVSISSSISRAVAQQV
jgi:hypothetical protein